MSLMPADWTSGTFLGRADFGEGPSPILVVRGELIDMSVVAPTVSALVEAGDFSGTGGKPLGAFDPEAVNLLSPVDLQCVKACGVTFATSAIERVIEERARGDWSAAAAIRERLESRIGGQIRSVVPGSEGAAALKAALIEDGLWSQYLEVAIGPDAEVFTKSPVLSTVGVGAEIGVRSDSSWNNPEPEIALLVGSDGQAVGATLGNDVNLRDFEGRSALLLGKAKDNNASCALGPFIRLFDEHFTPHELAKLEVSLHVTGRDGFEMQGVSPMAAISRTPADLAGQLLNRNHQYPDGAVLFLGTMFAPVKDRRGPGQGFTHEVGDRVEISTPWLGSLVNWVDRSDACPEWTFGVRELLSQIVRRATP